MRKQGNRLLLLILCCVQFSRGIDICQTLCRCTRQDTDVKCYVNNNDELLEISKNINSNVNRLTLKENKLTEFNISFNLPKLKMLDLRNNLLKTIPKHLNSQFPILEDLWLDNNQITEIIYPTLEGMMNLKKLSLSNNQITSLGKGAFQDLSNMLQLLLNDNSISKLSVDAFQSLTKIVNLQLKNNHITKLEPGLFGHFNSTQITIDLTSNYIKELRNGVFDSRQKNFDALVLASNQISVIEDAVFRNMNIKDLYLQNNSLVDLSPKSFMNSSISNVFVVVENKLKCSCELRSFIIGPEVYINDIYGNCKDKNETLDFQQISKQSFSKDEVSRLFCTQCQINNTCLNGAVCHAIDKTGLTCGCVNDYYGETCENEPICLSVELSLIHI